ncbi:MAG: Crp/Fnr family transcriptional regulator [Chitinophagaceae bacterium]|nr:MAG: Crp/Fnr family transcriptional regulator [Chitinophagaceae bacterium]
MAVKKGKTLFREGDPVTGIYFIYTGAVKVHKQWTEGKELILRFAKRGDILGHRGLSDKVYPVSTTTLEDSRFCFISTEFLEATLKTNPAFTYEMLYFYADELQKAENRMRNLAHMDVKGRIADALLQLHTFFGSDPAGTIDAKISRQDIASYAGSTYETVFKFFNELSAQGILSTEGKSLRINDPARLRAFVTAQAPTSHL